MATAFRKQDMPPPGGFRPLDYSRVPSKKVFGAKSLIFGHFAVTAGALYLYSWSYRKVYTEEIENRSSMLAITPLLRAERDREYLKQMRRNRDEEAKLMANVEGWEVGKYKGEHIYKSLPPDTFHKPHISEYYAHASYDQFCDDVNILLWQ